MKNIISRRRLLIGAATATSILVAKQPAMAEQENYATYSPSERVIDTVRALQQRAKELGVELPTQPTSATEPNFPLSLARAVSDVLDTADTSDIKVQLLLEDTGSLLSEVNAEVRDLSIDQQTVSAAPQFSALKEEYRSLFTTAQVSPGRRSHLNDVGNFILMPNNLERYKAAEKVSKVPWYVIAALHYREASLNFMGHLHNGDPLKRKTIQVPLNRPRGTWPQSPWDPRVAWQLSAEDALLDIKRPPSWTVERMLYVFEGYNGWGYRGHQGFRSPYLWGFTQHYSSGGFPRDHYWSNTYVSKQAGLASIIVVLSRMAPKEVDLQFET